MRPSTVPRTVMCDPFLSDPAAVLPCAIVHCTAGIMKASPCGVRITYGLSMMSFLISFTVPPTTTTLPLYVVSAATSLPL